MQNPQHDVSGPISWAVSAILWVASLLPAIETGMRLGALALSMVASVYAIHHYRKKS